MLEETTAKNKVVKKNDKSTTPEVKKETKEVVEDKVEVVTDEFKSEPKMGVVAFLELEPQDVYVEELLKATHGTDIMTQSEWEQTLDDLLNKKITE